jgi:hypothetical protein
MLSISLTMALKFSLSLREMSIGNCFCGYIAAYAQG